VSIRKTLLIAFLSVSLACAMLLAGLAFVQARSAVQAEIERNLAVQASGIATEVDKMMFERLQNAATWSRLDIMQDLQLGDIDKRMSQFLADLRTGYGDVFLDLSCVDNNGRVVSSSDAARIGRSEPTQAAWIRTSLSGTDVVIEAPAGSPATAVVMRVAVPGAYARGKLGELRLGLDWARITDVLDQAASGNGRMLAILDRGGRVIAASTRLRASGLLASDALAGWRTVPGAATVATRDGQAIGQADLIVASAASPGYVRFTGFGWTTLVIQPVARAMTPVHRMGLSFLGFLALVALITFLIANRVSREIARPIVALTGIARAYMHDKVLQVPAANGRGEVGELARAFVHMVRDIDLSRRNLVRASKLAVVGEMSSIIAHEIRTPLGIVRTSAQMLQRESGISLEGLELVGFIDTETERLNRLVSAMLDTARPRAPRFTRVNMHDLIPRSIAMLDAQAAGKQIRVTTSLHARHPGIESDEEQMLQVLLNLLMNALQILDPGGRVEVGTHDDGPWFCIDIADDGPGLAPEERSRVFEAFFFRREGGIGLGLAIVQQIVNSHGGEITASESDLGGALFSLRLPRERKDKQ
jgi:two-component system sensor histidine kinase HydH